MNANKSMLVLLLSVLAGSAAAQINNSQHLNNSGQAKVQGAMAKSWMKSEPKGDGYTSPVQQKQVVNIGNKKAGNCSVNVGTVQPGQKAPKEIVVTTKEVINVCK